MPFCVFEDWTRVTILALGSIVLSMAITFTPASAAAFTAGTRPWLSRTLITMACTPWATMSSTSAICLFRSLPASDEITVQPSSSACALAATSWAAK